MKEYKNALLRELRSHGERSEAEDRLGRASMLEALSQKKARIDSGRVLRLRLAAAGAAVAVVALFVVFTVNREQGTANTAHRTGPMAVAVATFSGEWKVGDGGGVGDGRTVRTPEGRGAKLNVGGDSVVWIGEGATFAITAAAADRVTLEAGRVLVSVDPREERSFAVDTPAGRVSVLGTVFSVAVEEDGVRVRLYRGSVEFTTKAKDGYRIAPGETLDVEERGGQRARRDTLSLADAFGDLLIAEPFVKNRPGESARVPDLLSIAEGLLAPESDPVSASDHEGSPSPEGRRRPSNGRRKGVIKADDKRARIQRHDGSLSSDTAARHEPSEEELFAPIQRLFDERDCQKVVAKAVEYIVLYPAGEHIDEVVYYKGYCQAYRGDLSGGRESLEVYFSKFRDGRYWHSIKDILEE